MLAQSLNRLGNWQLNRGEPQEALRLHHEALARFEQARDQRGIASTHDLIGMASYNSADLPGCVSAYERAAAHFQRLDDRQGLTSSLSMLTVRGGTYAITSRAPDPDAFARAVHDGEHALAIARSIDWRAGEAFALITLGWALGPQGAFDRALEHSRQGLQIGEEIEHHQWIAGAHWTLGMLHLDFLDLAAAREHLTQALVLAETISSPLWTEFATAGLALAELALGETREAARVLNGAYDPAAPVRSLGTWLLRYAHLRVALAEGDPAGVLRLLDGPQPAVAPRASGPRDTPRLACVRGEALAALGRSVDAEAALRGARDLCRVQGARPQLWRTRAALSALYDREQRDEAAHHEAEAAQALLDELALKVPDLAAREAFTRRGRARLPQPYRRRQAASAGFGGLTAREREVARMIAEGLSNREIAAMLVLSVRTVEDHVGRLLAKLKLRSRAHVAAWSSDSGLTGHVE